MEETPAPAARNRCHVCGWDFGEDPWDFGAPQYLICSCCGAESGLDDSSQERARTYLSTWLAGGAVWSDPDDRPADWSPDDLSQQLLSIGVDRESLPPPRIPMRARRHLRWPAPRSEGSSG